MTGRSDSFGGFGTLGGEIAHHILVIRVKTGVADVGGGDLEAVEEEGSLASVNGSGKDSAEDPLQGALDGVGVFEEEELRVQRDAGGLELFAVGFWLLA